LIAELTVVHRASSISSCLFPAAVRLIFYTTVSEVIDYQRVAVLETA